MVDHAYPSTIRSYSQQLSWYLDRTMADVPIPASGVSSTQL
jgi:hypothetical protein